MISQFLHELDRFTGLFIATTNNATVLDKSAYRRFDLKIQFRSMRHEQAMRMLENLGQSIGIPHKPDALAERRLQKLTGLNPGDFNVLYRRHQIQPAKADYPTLIDQLEEELEFRKQG